MNEQNICEQTITSDGTITISSDTTDNISEPFSARSILNFLSEGATDDLQQFKKTSDDESDVDSEYPWQNMTVSEETEECHSVHTDHQYYSTNSVIRDQCNSTNSVIRDQFNSTNSVTRDTEIEPVDHSEAATTSSEYITSEVVDRVQNQDKQHISKQPTTLQILPKTFELKQERESSDKKVKLQSVQDICLVIGGTKTTIRLVKNIGAFTESESERSKDFNSDNKSVLKGRDRPNFKRRKYVKREKDPRLVDYSPKPKPKQNRDLLPSVPNAAAIQKHFQNVINMTSFRPFADPDEVTVTSEENDNEDVGQSLGNLKDQNDIKASPHNNSRTASNCHGHTSNISIEVTKETTERCLGVKKLSSRQSREIKELPHAIDKEVQKEAPSPKTTDVSKLRTGGIRVDHNEWMNLRKAVEEEVHEAAVLNHAMELMLQRWAEYLTLTSSDIQLSELERCNMASEVIEMLEDRDRYVWQLIDELH